MRTLAAPVRALLLSISVVLLLGSAAQAADQKAPKTDAAKIANAMTAAPAAVSRNANVVEMSEDGSMKVLRKGPDADANAAFRAAGVNRWVGSPAIKIYSWGSAYRGYI